MSNLNPEKKYVQLESTQTRDAVGENLIQTIGGSVNFALDTLGINYQFKLNGPYKTAAGRNNLDGFLIFDWDAEIFEVQMYSYTPGNSGATTFDLKYSPGRNGPFSSIFTTTPSVTPTAVHPTYVGIGDVVSGATAPVLTSTPFLVSRGGWLKLDVIGTMSGGASDAGIIIKYRPA